MRTIRFVLLGLAATFLTAASLHAQEQRRRPLAGAEQVGGPLVSKEALEKLKLTSEQQAKIDKIVKEFDDKAKNNEIKARDAMQKARADKDRAAAQQAQEKLTEARKVREGYLGQVHALLTDDQKKALDRSAATTRPGGPAASGGAFLPPALQERLNLTAEQKEKLNQLQKDFETKALKVLTDEQRQKYEQFKKGRSRQQEQPRRPQGLSSAELANPALVFSRRNRPGLDR